VCACHHLDLRHRVCAHRHLAPGTTCVYVFIIPLKPALCVPISILRPVCVPVITVISSPPCVLSSSCSWALHVRALSPTSRHCLCAYPPLDIGPCMRACRCLDPGPCACACHLRNLEHCVCACLCHRCDLNRLVCVVSVGFNYRSGEWNKLQLQIVGPCSSLAIVDLLPALSVPVAP